MHLPSLLSLPEDNQVLVELPNRLSIWLRCEQLPLEGTPRSFPATMPGSTIPPPPPESSPEEASCDLKLCRPGAAMTEDNAGISEALPLRALDKDYIERTVRACGGNVSKAAKQLDVSRGLIYRRLRD
jgi:DNA-binding NtrC family response regulator